MQYLYIVATVIFALYGQLILKWRLVEIGAFPEGFHEILNYFIKVFIDPFVISSFISFFIAALFWIVSLTKFELNYAYPFVLCVSILLVFFMSSFFFKEQITGFNITGIICILAGLILMSK